MGLRVCSFPRGSGSARAGLTDGEQVRKVCSLSPCQASPVGTVRKQEASQGDAWGTAAAERPKLADQLGGAPHPAATWLDPPRPHPISTPHLGCSQAEWRED